MPSSGLYRKVMVEQCQKYLLEKAGLGRRHQEPQRGHWRTQQQPRQWPHAAKAAVSPGDGLTVVAVPRRAENLMPFNPLALSG